ncbi:MAG TPA: YcxB family protein [Streptosporangiales bacterium]
MTEPIELHWTPELRDSLQATRVLAGRRLAAFAGLLVLVGVVELALHQFWLGVLALVLGPVFVLLQLLTAVLVFRRNTAGRRVDAVADAHGVRVARAGATTEYAWSVIAEWREASRVFVLRAGGARSVSVVVLPKRALTEADSSTLRNRFTEHVGRAGSRRTVQLATSPRPQPVTTTPSAAAAPDDGGRVELHWTPERADWVEAIRSVSAVHRLLPWFAVLLVVAGVAWSAASYHTTPDGYSMNMAFVVAVPLGVFVGSLTSLQARAVLRRNPLVAGEQHVTLDEGGLHFRVAGTDASTDWTAYAGFRERRRSFVLRHGRSSLTPVTLLAKRGVVAPHTADDVRALLERRLGAGSGHETS